MAPSLASAPELAKKVFQVAPWLPVMCPFSSHVVSRRPESAFSCSNASCVVSLMASSFVCRCVPASPVATWDVSLA